MRQAHASCLWQGRCCPTSLGSGQLRLEPLDRYSLRSPSCCATGLASRCIDTRIPDGVWVPTMR